MKASHLQRTDRNVRRRLWGHWKARVRLKHCLRGGQKGKREEGPRHQIFIYANRGLHSSDVSVRATKVTRFREASANVLQSMCHAVMKVPSCTALQVLVVVGIISAPPLQL